MESPEEFYSLCKTYHGLLKSLENNWRAEGSRIKMEMLVKIIQDWKNIIVDGKYYFVELLLLLQKTWDIRQFFYGALINPFDVRGQGEMFSA